MTFYTEKFAKLIDSRLRPNLQQLKNEFEQNASKCGVRHLAIDDFLPENHATEIHQSFQPASTAWREMKSFRERKLTTKQYDQFPKVLGEITFAIQDPAVVNLFAEITGIKSPVGDPGLYAGGLSMMRAGDFLNPHIDNSHDQDRKLYRRLNLLYYVTPNWKLEDGGHLELWDENVTKPVVVESRFNRMVLMETTHTSYHSVNQVKKAGYRCCVSNYYFSPISPNGSDYFHVTEFKGRPEEPIKRAVSLVDTLVRSMVRKVKKSGLGVRDVYEAAPEKKDH